MHLQIRLECQTISMGITLHGRGLCKKLDNSYSPRAKHDLPEKSKATSSKKH